MPGTLCQPLFVQISDTHTGFNKDANPDVNGTLTQTIDLVNGMSEQPALIIHTGDITHLSKPAEFDVAQQMFSRLRTTESHTTWSKNLWADGRCDHPARESMREHQRVPQDSRDIHAFPLASDAPSGVVDREECRHEELTAG